MPQSHVTLVKNENYWDAANVKIDKVVYVVTEDDQTELKRYKAGELDTTNEIPSNQLEAVKEEFGQEVRITPYLEFAVHLLQHHQGAVRQHQGAAGAGDRHRSQGAAGQDPESRLPGQLRLLAAELIRATSSRRCRNAT